jgi:uncharacterized membrane protein
VTTIDGLTFTITLVAALACGLMAGLFFAFSVAVMKALARLPSAEGIGAMQSINVAIINPLFLAVFFGTAAACVLVMIASLLRLRSRYRILAHRRRALFGWHLFSHVGVQRAQEQRVGLGRAGRRRQLMD